VFGIHHKPCGLTSLSSCHSSQVHKVQHKSTKTSICAASGAPDTVRCPGQGTHKLAALGVFLESLHYNSPDYLVYTGHVRRANGATVNCAQRSTAVNSGQCRSQKSELQSQNTPYCPVCHRTVRCCKRTKDFNGQPLQTPTVS
jgi:hypothetical protein